MYLLTICSQLKNRRINPKIQRNQVDLSYVTTDYKAHAEYIMKMVYLQVTDSHAFDSNKHLIVFWTIFTGFQFNLAMILNLYSASIPTYYQDASCAHR